MKFLSENKLFVGLFALALLLGVGYHYAQAEVGTSTDTVGEASVDSESALETIQPAINIADDEAAGGVPIIEITPKSVESNKAAESDAGADELLIDQREEVRIE